MTSCDFQGSHVDVGQHNHLRHFGQRHPDGRRHGRSAEGDFIFFFKSLGTNLCSGEGLSKSLTIKFDNKLELVLR